MKEGVSRLSQSYDQVTKRKLEQFIAGVNRLHDVLHPAVETEYRNDAVIQRFEFCYEMAWKLLKRVLEEKGIVEATPKDVFKSAFTSGYLGKDAEGWFSMIKSRNMTSHIYSESMAAAIVSRVESEYYPLLEALCTNIKENADES
jgi:nucleotidyltransferase substrate binding protein (TIGR01987 family)